MVLKAYNLMGLSAFLRHQVLRELDIHARLHNPSIVHLIAAFKVRRAQQRPPPRGTLGGVRARGSSWP